MTNPCVKSQSKICHHEKYIYWNHELKNPCVKSQSNIYVIMKNIFIGIMNKKIRVLNHSQKFMSS